MPDDLVRLAITRDEALVLHEWLSRVVDDGNAAGITQTIEDDAELWALHGLLTLLEQVVTEPLEPGFEKRLDTARRHIFERSGSWPRDLDDE